MKHRETSEKVLETQICQTKRIKQIKIDKHFAPFRSKWIVGALLTFQFHHQLREQVLIGFRLITNHWKLSVYVQV